MNVLPSQPNGAISHNLTWIEVLSVYAPAIASVAGFWKVAVITGRPLWSIWLGVLPAAFLALVRAIRVARRRAAAGRRMGRHVWILIAVAVAFALGQELVMDRRGGHHDPSSAGTSAVSHPEPVKQEAFGEAPQEILPHAALTTPGTITAPEAPAETTSTAETIATATLTRTTTGPIFISPKNRLDWRDY